MLITALQQLNALPDNLPPLPLSASPQRQKGATTDAFSR